MGIKNKLEAAGYDTSGLDEPTLLAKLEKAGYDTSSIKPSMMDQVKQNVTTAMSKVPQTPMSTVAGFENVMQEGLNRGANTLRNANVGGIQPFQNTLDPMLAATQNAPKIAGIATMAPALESGVEAIGEKGLDALKTVGKRITTGKNMEKVASLRDEMGALGEQKAAKLAQLEELRDQAGRGIETARNEAGIPQKLSGLPEVGSNLNETADFFKSKIGGMTPEQLVQTYGKDGLAQLRDIAQTTKDAGVSATQNAFINRGVSRIDQALELVAPDVAKGYKAYGETVSAADATPQDFMNKRIQLQQQIRALQPKANAERAVRYGLGVGAGASPFIIAALKKLAGAKP